MKADVYNKKNEKVGEVDLSDKIFGVKWNPNLVRQALSVLSANSRVKFAHSKDRSEVSGGGKKPWRQKGTGRARHGSIRSPLWKGGGVTFGPVKGENFSRKINKKMNKLAIFSVLSKKFKEEHLKVVDDLKEEKNKTKSFSAVLKNLLGEAKTAIIVPSDTNKGVGRAAKNIKGIDSISPKSLNVYDLMKSKKIIMEKNAVNEIESHYLKTK